MLRRLLEIILKCPFIYRLKGRTYTALCLSLCCVLFTIVMSSPVIAQENYDISIVDDESVHVPDEYEVEEGDTLWLISQEFFQDPWLWPNLWALNPHITNPHWIYPGDLIRLKWNPRIQRNTNDNLALKPVGYSADLKKEWERTKQDSKDGKLAHASGKKVENPFNKDHKSNLHTEI